MLAAGELIREHAGAYGVNILVINATYNLARRIAISIVGATVLLVGVIMIFAPGPAFIVIPVGLAILSIEFAWARYWLKRLRLTISRQGANGRSERAEAHRNRTSDPF